jgi:hypothetical protein
MDSNSSFYSRRSSRPINNEENRKLKDQLAVYSTKIQDLH